MSIEILDCLKRQRDICVKNVIPSQNTAFMYYNTGEIENVTENRRYIRFSPHLDISSHPPTGELCQVSSLVCKTTQHRLPSAKCLFAQNLGPNPSEMEVRTFVSKKKVIWEQLLAFRALIFEKKAFFNFYVISATPWINYQLIALSRFVFCFFLICSRSRSFFRLNHLRNVRKRCSHPIFSSRAIILDFLDQNVNSCYVHAFRLLWATITYSALTQRWPRFLLEYSFAGGSCSYISNTPGNGVRGAWSPFTQPIETPYLAQLWVKLPLS